MTAEARRNNKRKTCPFCFAKVQEPSHLAALNAAIAVCADIPDVLGVLAAHRVALKVPHMMALPLDGERAPW